MCIVSRSKHAVWTNHKQWIHQWKHSSQETRPGAGKEKAKETTLALKEALTISKMPRSFKRRINVAICQLCLEISLIRPFAQDTITSFTSTSKQQQASSAQNVSLTINYQESPADRKIRDTIHKNTVQNTNQGVITGKGFSFKWPLRKTPLLCAELHAHAR
jgi:hypothetical protein